jgi:methylated-DNA-[protein]-cysteine S-methyltransferase
MTTLQAPSLAPNALQTAALPAFIRRVDSPIGRIEITSEGDTVTSLTIEKDGHLPLEHTPEVTNDVLETAASQLDEYFAGTRKTFDVPVSYSGTAFQRAIWEGLTTIEWGTAATYGALGRVAGREGAGRAVGGAVGSNPVPIIIPCHRVLASNGRITGYSMGEGIPTKIWLLDHEGIPHR